MASVAMRIFVLVYAAWWLGVFMPGHQRGQVKVAGQNQPSACHACPATGETQPSDAPKESSTHCAVCVVLARLNPPPVLDLDVPELRLLDELDPLPVVAQRHAAPRLAVLHGRAPPAVCVVAS